MRFLRVAPFTAIGLLTIGLFVLLESLDPATRHQHVWQPVIQIERLLIVPVWLMRIVVVSAGIKLFGTGNAFPAWFDLATIPVLLIPHFALDLLLFLGRSRARTAPG